MKDEVTTHNKEISYLTPKKETVPLVSVSGNTILEIINRLWKQNDKIDSKERTYTPKN